MLAKEHLLNFLRLILFAVRNLSIYFLEEIVKRDNEFGNYIKLKQYTTTNIAQIKCNVNPVILHTFA